MAATTENYNYDEIVKKSNYKFNLPLEELINNSKATRRAKLDKKQVIPRPPNAYMIYRTDKAASTDIKSLELSRKNFPQDFKYLQEKSSNTSKSSKNSSNFILSKL
ncbi:hypothetical protein RhiirA4_450571 [Rhizophagus irregularis]|uniref:Uncharacterized protein n=1 Tax=Rhizophagus irregularis TaxID=588596 RepID=A0A2I1FTK7_9GLOM|nr:hypothetical protein RhiirA4_450571 [Rhizophagus irregularis]